MLLALPALARVGYKVNARGCRQFSEGLSVLRDARRRHRLPHLAVLALGADASISAGQIVQAKKVMGPKRKLGLVTPRELGGGESNDARVIRNAGQRDPAHIKVLDWVRYSAGHDSWFQPDGLHLTFSGAKAFARLCKKLIPLAAARPQHPGAKGEARSDLHGAAAAAATDGEAVYGNLPETASGSARARNWAYASAPV
jgi:hypothetical protein